MFFQGNHQSEEFYLQKLISVMKKFVVLFFFTGFLFSQNDTLYYKKALKSDLSVRVSMYRNLFDFRVMKPKNRTYFLPNQIGNVSVGFSHYRLPFEISAGIGVGKVRSSYPKTKSFDIQFHKYGRDYVIDAFFNKYKGFYIDNYVDNIINTDLTTEQRSFKNLNMMLIGVFGQYIFNGKRFSYQAAFNRKEVQLKSAGSFLLGGSIYYFDLETDKPIFENTKSILEKQMGVNAGYSYNWVLNSKWLLNASATGGLNINTDLKMRPNYVIRASCFYNAKNWIAGVSAFSNTIMVYNVAKTQSWLDSGQVTFTVIRGFDLRNRK